MAERERSDPAGRGGLGSHQQTGRGVGVGDVEKGYSAGAAWRMGQQAEGTGLYKRGSCPMAHAMPRGTGSYTRAHTCLNSY